MMTQSLVFNSDTRKWELTLPPELMFRAKRIFAGAKGQHGTLEISDTLANVDDLKWFLDRYPVDVADLTRLESRVADSEKRELLHRAVQASTYAPPSELELALPLRDYQNQVVSALYALKRILLADDLGIGKTASSIGGLTLPGSLPAVVVTETALVHQWEREVKRFLPSLRTHVLKSKKPYDLTLTHGRVRSKTPKPFPDVVITSYSKISGWADELGPRLQYLICDECQGLRTGTANTIPEKYRAVKYLSERAAFVLFASATPIYNFGGEFFAVIDALSPGHLGTIEEFGSEWCNGAYANTARIEDPRRFGNLLLKQGVMIRRTRDEVKRELPALQEIVHEVDCDEDVLKSVESDCRMLAERILSDTKLERGQVRDAAREFDMRLRQATGIAKASYVAAFVRMLVEQGEPVVLFGWHRAVYDIWLQKLVDLNPVLYTGSETLHEKEEAKRKFMEGETKLLIMSLRSGAGLDGLQHICRTGVFGELDYSKGVHSQCGGRIHRDMQLHPVFLYYMLSDHGSDPPMMDLLGVKRGQLEGAINPNADFVESLEVDVGRVRSMAEQYLRAKKAG